MDKITLKEKVTLYDEMSKVTIDSPAAGMVVGNHPAFSIIPKFVEKGESEVVVIRQTGIVTIEADEEVGYVAIATPAEKEAE